MNAKRIILALAAAAMITSCNKPIVIIADEDLVPSKVYFVANDVGSDLVRELSYLDIGDPYGYHKLALYKSGIKNDPASVKIDLLTDAELRDYNQKYGKGFVKLDPAAYSIGQKELEFSGSYDDINRTVEIRFDLEALRSAGADAVLPLKITESSVEVAPERSMIILKPTMPKVMISFSGGVKQVGYVDDGSLSKDIRLSLETILGLEENRWDIDVELMVDEEYIDEYNLRESTSYTLLESGKYTLDMVKTIAAGEISGSHQLVIKKENFTQPGQYMLPLRLKGSSMFSVDPNSLYCITIDIWSGTKLDRSDWDVPLYSAYEPAEAGNNNALYPRGYPIAILDGDIESYWHSPWKPDKVPPPHFLVIDMKEQHLIEQVEMIQRQKYSACKDMELYMGNDIGALDGLSGLSDLAEMQELIAGAATWKKVAVFQMRADIAPQVFSVTRTSARYLMVLIVSSHRADFVTSLAEVYPYGS